MLSQLGNRMFLMNNVHDDHPQFFQARWALSYLRGPLSRQQIQTLMAPKRAELLSSSLHANPNVAELAKSLDSQPSPSKVSATSANSVAVPVLAADIPQYFLPVTSSRPAGASLIYTPMMLGLGRIFFNDTKLNVTNTSEVAYLAEFQPPPVLVDWTAAQQVPITASNLSGKTADATASFASVPADAAKAKNYEVWKKSLADWLFHGFNLTLFQSPSMGTISQPGESQRDFVVRLQVRARSS